MPEEKPFEATSSRLARAKREGDIPRSQQAIVVASLGGAAAALLVTLPVFEAAAERALLDAASQRGVTPQPYVAIATCVLATIVCALLGALVATFLQTRAVTFTFPAPKFEKLDPRKGLGRMFSRESVVTGAKASAVAIAVTVSLVPAVRRSFAAAGSGATAERLAELVGHALQAIVASALAVAAPFAAADVLLERLKWRKRLRMSFDELKREHKASDGDPQLKGRRRQAHRTLVRGSIGRVADAAFVVANPTHVAVALEYRPPEVAVPRVIVRAIDEGALQVKRRARELRVPVVQNVALARSLLATTGVGEFIAPGLYAAVAAVVAALAREPGAR